MTRLQQILSTVLVVQIALAVWLNLPQGTAAVPSMPLLADLQAEKIAAVTIDDGKDNSAVLVKQGGQWVLSNGGDYPADVTKIDDLIKKLLALKTGRIVSRTEASQKQLEVAEASYSKRVQLETDNKTLYTLYIGSSPQGSSVHVRLKGQNDVYLCDGISNWEVGALPSNWIDAKYINYPESDIKALTLENANGKFEFEKSQSGWTLKGQDQPFDQDKFLGLLQRLAPLNMSMPLGKEDKPEYGLSSPAATLTLSIEQKDAAAKTVVLKIGSKDAKGEAYIIKASDLDYFVKANTVAVETWVKSAKEDFIKQQQPTPQPQ